MAEFTISRNTPRELYDDHQLTAFEHLKISNYISKSTDQHDFVDTLEVYNSDNELFIDPKTHYNHCKVADLDFEVEQCQVCSMNRQFLRPEPNFIYDQTHVEDFDVKSDKSRQPEIGKLFLGGLPPNFNTQNLQQYQFEWSETENKFHTCRL